MSNRFWIGGSGQWADTAHWSISSGGSGGASVPTSSDDVIVDANSGSGSLSISNSVDGSAGLVRSFDSSAYSSPITFNMSIWFYGSIKTHVNTRLGIVSIRGAGPVNILSSLMADVVTVQLDNKTSHFYTNDFAISVAAYSADFTVLVGTAHLGSSTITCGGIEISTTTTVSIDAGTSTFVLTDVRNSDIGVRLGHQLYKVSVQKMATAQLVTYGLTATILELAPKSSLSVKDGTTIAIDTLVANGTSTNQIILRSTTSGVPFTITKSSGTVDAYYLDIKDSNATGGATWNARNSNDSGNNTGWNFLGPTVPVADFTASPTTGRAPLSVNFTDVSAGIPDTWLWTFGDGTTSTLQNPTKVYLTPGSYSVSLYASNSLGGDTETKTAFIAPLATIIEPASVDPTNAVGSPTVVQGAAPPQFIQLLSIDPTNAPGDPALLPGPVSVAGLGDIALSPTLGSPTVVQSDPPPPPPTDWEAIGKEDEKEYIYRVYTAAGVFLGIWTDVIDELQFTQSLNSPGTTTTVRLGRSPNTTKEVRAQLVTQAGDRLTTEDGFVFAITYETNNTVGAGTDVEINHRVDIEVQYGEFDRLITQMSDYLTTESGDYLLAGTGAPNGKRVFSGFILDYESLYGEQNGVTVTIASNGAELAQQIVKNVGGDVAYTASSAEIATHVKTVLDTNPGRMTYDAASITNTGVSVPLNVSLNSKLEIIENMVNQSPSGTAWYGNVAENKIYIFPQAVVADHKFKIGYHVKSMALKRSQEQLRNNVYFVGKEDAVTGISILKQYQDTPSQTAWRSGLHRIVDRRYSVNDSIQRRSEKEMSRFKNPIYTTTVTISSARYDLESIKLGQMVAFANTDGMLLDLLLQIVNLTYTPTAVTIQLGELLDTQWSVIDEIESDLQNEQFQRLPNQPS